uniref:Putative K(+)-stimulated pyrophosphate-energized sodium pump n=1 Tax=uncultured Chloroflexota bacterium TaxID=166587 RepID=H5SN39_9CHLR|nr:inorganic pyrophosphatase [uncultured Chloroflexota bacterium]
MPMSRLNLFLLTILFILVAAPAAMAAPATAESVREPLPWLWWLAPVGSLIALAFVYHFYQSTMKLSEGTELMAEIAHSVREGAMAYLRRQYSVVAIAFVVLFLLFVVLAYVFGVQNRVIPFAFITGGFFSGLCGFIGMKTATNASARTANAARQSLNDGLQVAFRAGAVMGLVVVGFALLDISAWFLILYYLFPPEFFGESNPLPQITVIMLSFGMGASTQALFARVGGGIYTKAADVGADLVGKVEAGIPEDDPRNPATIADNVGDNVGDVAGMGADLYESYAGSILATAALGVAAVATEATRTNGAFLAGFTEIGMQLRYLAAPLALAAVGVILSIVGIYMVRTKEDATMGDLMGAINNSITYSSIGIAIVALIIVHLLQLNNPWMLWLAIVAGLAVGVVIGRSTEYYTSDEYPPTKGIAEQSLTGPATVIIEGLAVGMRSTGIPVVAIIIGIVISFYLPGGAQNTLVGLYGVGLAAVAMLSTLGLTLATDAYGPIADNAGGNAEMSHLPPEVRRRTDQLDAVGNTTAATGKGFAIGSAALTALALLAAYLEEIRFGLRHLGGIESVNIRGAEVLVAKMTLQDFAAYYDVSLLNPAVLVGVFSGAMTVFFFSAMTMKAVGRAAGAMVQEVRRQFKEKPGILEGTDRPDYARCVAISTAGAQKEMIAPSLLGIGVPVVIGVLFGVPGVLGLLAGALATGFAVAVMMANAGGAWDNAKKSIEKGAYGGKGSDPHKATVVGDTVGDPFKDTTGPSLNILIKLMSMVSIVFAGLIAQLGTGGLLGMLIGG